LVPHAEQHRLVSALFDVFHHFVFGSVLAFWMNPDRPLVLEDSMGPSFKLA
jgi:hypothetical protein